MPKYVQICSLERNMTHFIGLFYYSPQKMFAGQIVDNSSRWYAVNLPVSVDGNTITWYEGSNSDYQLNDSNTSYYYVAIG